MFVATTINFLLSSLVAGAEVSIFVGSIGKVLILDIDYPLPAKLELLKNAVWNLYIAVDWAGGISASTNPSLPDSVTNNTP